VLAGQLPRLLTGTPNRPANYREHVATFGELAPGGDLLAELERAGLVGRGGAAFPTATKARLIATQRGRHKFVVVNAMEGEPASHKDALLLATNPHLVLDGAEALAGAVGATAVVVAVARDRTATLEHVTRALAERPDHGISLDLQTPPGRYVAGEESALVHWLNDHESLPQYRPHRPSVLHLDKRPVLLDNAETHAHVALIARFGAAWFASLGPSSHPGSTLVSVSGAVERPTVLEVALGTPLRQVLAAAHADPDPQAVLLGGYGGTWLAPRDFDVTYDRTALAERGATAGAGIVIVVGRADCGVAEAQRIAAWMAHESARQCGPCAFGLPAIAADLARLRDGGRDAREARLRLEQRCAVVEGRGACRHPDGVVRMIRTALAAFAEDVADHEAGRPCAGGRSERAAVAVPHLERESELVWE
jgi:NADH:ubiquinone oxidoreductase subunit F (NADH-binding)